MQLVLYFCCAIDTSKEYNLSWDCWSITVTQQLFHLVLRFLALNPFKPCLLTLFGLYSVLPCALEQILLAHHLPAIFNSSVGLRAGDAAFQHLMVTRKLSNDNVGLFRCTFYYLNLFCNNIFLLDLFRYWPGCLSLS